MIRTYVATSKCIQVFFEIFFIHYRMPILYNNISGGRFLCALFFICISLAGFSSMVSLMERTIRVAIDFGSMCVQLLARTTVQNHFVNVVRRIPATIVIGLVTFFIGLGSALNIDILINQVTMFKIVSRYMWMYIHTKCVT